MTFDAKALSRALRGAFWPALRQLGFLDRTERVGWRYSDGDVDVVEVQAVGQHAEACGCTAASVSVVVASYPRFLRRNDGLPSRDGRVRPHYWHCHPFEQSLAKTLSQPWFRAFSAPLDRSLPSFRAHRDGLKAILTPPVHDRPDIWYMRDDGSNASENVRDMTDVVLNAGREVLRAFHDPHEVLARIESGRLLSPTAPRAQELRKDIEFLLARGSEEA